MTATPEPTVQHNAAAQRFELTLDGHLSEATYEMRGGTMRLMHTEVPSALEGRGLAGKLVAAALAHARAQGLKVEPVCTYVQGYMRKRPETQDLLAP